MLMGSPSVHVCPAIWIAEYTQVYVSMSTHVHIVQSSSVPGLTGHVYTIVISFLFVHMLS